jgi:two-component system sensor histidine kinase UhpB
MSLRGQVLLSVVLALLLGFAVETAIACRQAQSSVGNEMRRALQTGSGIVADAVASLPATARTTYLTRLVRGFDGDRHIRLTLAAGGVTLAASRPAPPEAVPAWFVRLIAAPRQAMSRTLPGGMTLTLVTDPRNEISESWGQLRDGVFALLVFCVLVLLFLAIAMARAVRPLKKLNAQFESLGGGDYDARMDVSGPREVSSMAAGFNRMAERLGVLEASNRRLSGQMLAIQEEERADLARDLHDEMGPLLFSVRMGASGIAAEAEPEIAARARAIEDAATRMQAYVREILKQLRPNEGMDLAQAIGNLALFWRRQSGDVDVTLAMNRDVGLAPEMDAAIFRLVQEAVTNAVRHGGARHIHVGILPDGETLRVVIEDDGRGLAASPREGMGLKGMRERLAEFSGRLSLRPRHDGGAVLTAELPLAAGAPKPHEGCHEDPQR